MSYKTAQHSFTVTTCLLPPTGPPPPFPLAGESAGKVGADSGKWGWKWGDGLANRNKIREGKWRWVMGRVFSYAQIIFHVILQILKR